MRLLEAWKSVNEPSRSSGVPKRSCPQAFQRSALTSPGCDQLIRDTPVELAVNTSLLHRFTKPTVDCNCDLSLNTVVGTFQPGMRERYISKRIDGANVWPQLTALD